MNKLMYMTIILSFFFNSIFSQQIFHSPLGGTTLHTSDCNYGGVCATRSHPMPKHHTGVDFHISNGTDVLAAADSKIHSIYTLTDNNGNMGNTIILEHRMFGGDLKYTLYAHLHEIHNGLQEGDVVRRNDTLGVMGASGQSTLYDYCIGNPIQGCFNTHLHFEVKDEGVLGHPSLTNCDGTSVIDRKGYSIDEPDCHDYTNPLSFIGNATVISHPVLQSPKKEDPPILHSNITVNWKDVVGATNYHLHISENNDWTADNGFSNPVVNENITLGSAWIGSLNPGKTYYWTVKAGNSNTSSYFSKPFEFTTSEVENIYISNQQLASNSVPTGGTVYASCRQHYEGSRAVVPTIRMGYYLSDDIYFDENEDDLLGLDFSTINVNDPDDPEGATLLIPSNTTPGVKYILFIGDMNDLIYEENNADNIKYKQITVVDIANLPNIYTTNEVLSANNPVYRGQQISATCRQYINPCSAPYTGTYVGYYYSSDPYLSSNDVLLESDYSTVGNGDCYDPEGEGFNIPFSVPNGIGYILFVADMYNVHTESNENDNVRAMWINVVSGSYSSITPSNDKQLSHHDQYTISSNISIFPNPAKDNVIIDYSSSTVTENTLVTIYDLQGKLMIQDNLDTNDNRISIDVSKFPKGVYVLQVSNGQEFLSEKITIIE